MELISFKEFKKIYKTNNKNECTHLLLDGGKLNIPDDKQELFYKIYSESLLNDEKLMVVEKRKDIFRFMMDIDIIDEKYWDIDKIKILTKLIQEIVYDFYNIDSNVICCVAPLKKRDDGIKTGIHLIWPRLFTNSDNALLIREGIIYKLNEQNSIVTLNEWEDVIDLLIYTRNGYRMVYSDKLDTKTRKPENRPYELEFVMDSKGNLREQYYNRLDNDIELLVKETSIRNILTDKIEITKLPSWFPNKSSVNSKCKIQRNIKRCTYSNVDDENVNILSKFMESKLPKEYKGQCIREVRKYPDGNYLIITDSRHCMNIGREHNSCGIYFIATPMGIYQKCLCPCINLKDRITGYCKDYTSMCYSFNNMEQKILFDDKIIKKHDKSNNNMSNIKKKDKTKTEKVYYNVSSRNQKKNVYINNYTKFCEDFLGQL